MAADFALYGGLFLNAFVAATLLPAFSELSFAGLLAAGTGNALFLFLSVTAGNILGAIVNFWLGWHLAKYQSKGWFPFSAKQIETGALHFSRYGKWSLLFAWLPIVGDPLTLAAGLLRTDFRFFLMLVAVGKAARYVVIWATVTIFI